MAHQSNLKLNDENKKIDVIVSQMNAIRQQITHWHSYAYTATTWSLGIILGTVTYWLTRGGDDTTKWFLTVGTLVFAVLAQIYLRVTHLALNANGKVLVKCEACLGLTEQSAYLKNEPFFNESPNGKWITPGDIIALRFYHAAIGLLAVAAILFLR